MCSICQALNPTSNTGCEMHVDGYATVEAENTGADQDSVRAETFNAEQSVTVEDGNSSNGKPVYSLDQIADYLTEGYWNGYERKFQLDSSRTLDVNVNDLNAQGKALARAALESWSEVTGITFREVSDLNSADITFDDNQSGAFASSFTSGGRILSSHVNVSTSWLASQGTSETSYSYQTYIHEIGHALGLGHAGDYNGFANYSRDATYANDSWQASVMSYFSETQNGFVDASFGFVLTPQMADILAIQNLYGGASSARSGNTTYGVGASSDANVNILSTHAVTIFDGGGVDTINLSSKTNNQRLDLNQETFSDINGRTGNLGIARGAVIENAVLGSGNDTVLGNEVSNTIFGGKGFDHFDGNAGSDTINYASQSSSINADLAGGTATGNGIDTDTLISIENVTGGSAADTLTGSDSVNKVVGGAGNDHIFGRGNSDELDGGDGQDEIFGGFGEDLILGGGGADDLNGNAQADEIHGGSGNDTIVGGNGADTVFGDEGNDLIIGANDSDVLWGGSGNDTLRGQRQDDTLYGGEGDDSLSGGDGDDVLNGGADDDILVGENNSDVLNGDDGDDRLFGGAQADTLTGGEGEDTLDGGGGNDLLRGGTGNDVLNGSFNSDILYGDSGNDTLSGGTQADSLYGGSGNDQLDGESGSDLLLGEAGADQLFGGFNSDVLDGGTGNDSLTGGTEADTFIFRPNYDRDTITDFQNNVDKIDISAFGLTNSSAALGFANEVGSDVVFDFGSGDVLTVLNTSLTEVENDLLLM